MQRRPCLFCVQTPGLGMEGMCNWCTGSQEKSISDGNIEIITKYVYKKREGKEKEKWKEISLR